jgi:ABC-type bacteriocin/lantibiotic exporter with double-glycine peptidase domain
VVFFVTQPDRSNEHGSRSQTEIGWRESARLKRFIGPSAGRLTAILAVNLVATLLSLTQPYISKLLIDHALLRRDWNALWHVALLMFGATVLGFALNILSSYQCVRVSAAMVFDMRLGLYRHLQSLSPRFYAKWRLGDLVSRLNTDIGDGQRVSADSLLSVLSNVVFLAGSVAMMLGLNRKLFLLSVLLVPLCLYTFTHYQRKLTVLTKDLRETGADVGSLFVETLIGIRSVISANAANMRRGDLADRTAALWRAAAAAAGFLSVRGPAGNHSGGLDGIGVSVRRQADYRRKNDHRNAGGLHGISRAAAGTNSKHDGSVREPGFGPGVAAAHF